MPDPEFVSLGETSTITPQRIEGAEEKLDAALSYARAARVHLWGVYVMHRATDQLLDAYDGKAADLPMLDVDTLLMRPTLGCFVCEQAYEPRLRLRRCPGEPR